MFFKLVCIGNLGSDPERRLTQGGQSYTRFSLAVDREWTDASGEKRTETTWLRVVVWGKPAEACAHHLAKGQRVLIEADRVQASAYTGKDGQPAASLDVTARAVHFLGGGGRAPAEGAGVGEVVAERVFPF